MNERDDTGVGEQAPIHVATGDECRAAVGEPFRTGRHVDVRHSRRSAAWDVDFEDDEGGLEGL